MHSAYIIVVLILISVFLRLPFFFPAVINWDESTFILIGQSILDGELLYTTLWDMKPPLAFIPFAFFIFAFGKSILAIRLGGLLFVVATAYLTFLTGKDLYGKRAGLIAAGLCIVFISTAQAGQATMTEILAVLPLMGALAILVRQKYSPAILFFLGTLLSSAALIRLNLAYVAVAVGVYLLIKMRELQRPVICKNIFPFVGGGSIIVALVATPYLVTGKTALFFNSVFMAPLEYSNSHFTIFEALYSHLMNDFGLHNAVLWISFLFGASSIILKKIHGQTIRGSAEIGLFFFAVAWSIVTSGAAHGHYLIQIIPIMTLLAGFEIDRAIVPKTRLLVLILVFLGLIIPLSTIFSQYTFVAKRIIAGKTLSYGPQYEIAEWLKEANPQSEKIYLMTDHIVYWFISGKPLSKATTHPSIISKEYLLEQIRGTESSTTNEISEVLSLSPLFIVKKKETYYLKNKPEAKLILEQTLSEKYVKAAVIHGRYIYKRHSNN